jgi:hypothetical protein
VIPFSQVTSVEVSEKSVSSIFKGVEYDSTMRLEAGRSSKISVRICQNTWRHVREDSNLHCHHCQETQTSQAKNQLTTSTNNNRNTCTLALKPRRVILLGSWSASRQYKGHAITWLVRPLWWIWKLACYSCMSFPQLHHHCVERQNFRNAGEQPSLVNR